MPPRIPPSAAAFLFLALVPAVACNGTGAGAPGSSPGGDEDGALSTEGPDAVELEVVAENLDTPWEIRFLPTGDLLVTERPGRLVRIVRREGGGGPGRVVERHELPDVEEAGEGGLMGLALHPAYPSPPWIYVCHTTRGEDGLENRLVRFDYEEGELSAPTVLFPSVPGASIHDGCRLEFGPDGALYMTTGDAGSSSRAQDPDSPAGKVLRLTDEGEVPPDNPSGTAVWTLGHRNPQGLAFDAGGRLWATEHGPSGMRSGRDEVNLIVEGRNYGWPEITGDETGEGMVTPVLHSGADTWAPSGLAALDGRLVFAGLRGRSLYELRGVDGVEGVTVGEGAPGEGGASAPELRLIAHFRGELGRLRPVRVGPEGRLYFGTSNRDGRGSPREGDDHIFALAPDRLDEGG